jgi:REP element-mobilizing transposase RayT
MRRARIKEVGAYYHLMTRAIDRQMLLDDDEKELFGRMMRRAEGFSGVQILTHAILDNHTHILLYVPPPEKLSDGELLRRLRLLYSRPMVRSIEQHLRELRRQGQEEAAERLKAKYTYRMYDLSEFAKTLKQRFTQGYNARHGRSGTLWNGRFKSILVEGNGHALMTIAAYIDLNAVRAGIVSDPKDYRFCGYGQAVAGRTDARRGLLRAMQAAVPSAQWQQASEAYRKLLYMAGEERGVSEQGRALRPGFSPEKVKEVLDAGGTLSRPELLRCRVRYFTDGAILGSRAYVNAAFHRHREHFGRRRRSGARSMLGGGWGELCTARRLRLEPITLPTPVT